MKTGGYFVEAYLCYEVLVGHALNNLLISWSNNISSTEYNKLDKTHGGFIISY